MSWEFNINSFIATIIVWTPFKNILVKNYKLIIIFKTVHKYLFKEMYAYIAIAYIVFKYTFLRMTHFPEKVIFRLLKFSIARMFFGFLCF